MDHDLDAEYSPKAALTARARERARAAQQRRIESQRQYLGAEPIADDAELSAAVRRLASAWGLRKRKTKHHDTLISREIRGGSNAISECLRPVDRIERAFHLDGDLYRKQMWPFSLDINQNGCCQTRQFCTTRLFATAYV